MTNVKEIQDLPGFRLITMYFGIVNIRPLSIISFLRDNNSNAWLIMKDDSSAIASSTLKTFKVRHKNKPLSC